MKSFKLMVLAGLVVLPMAGFAQAADVDPVDVAPESEASGLYLRGDLGWSFLEWSGGKDDNTYQLGGGVGYQYNDNFRTDLTVDWANNFEIAPGASIDTTTVLGNLYFDWANDSAFTPYVGAGVGYGWVNGDGAPDDSGFAYGLTAGVAVDLTDRLALDVGYRFRDIAIDGEDPMEHQASVGLRFSF
jgi:opacity protein-like surface antigen